MKPAKVKLTPKGRIVGSLEDIACIYDYLVGFNLKRHKGFEKAFKKLVDETKKL